MYRPWKQKASCRSMAIVVRGDSDLWQLPPALSISGASLGSEDAFYEARARVPAGRFRGVECRGRKWEEDVCLVPHRSHLPLQRESGHCLGATAWLVYLLKLQFQARFHSALLLRKNDHRKRLSCPCPGSDLLSHFSASHVTSSQKTTQKASLLGSHQRQRGVIYPSVLL